MNVFALTFVILLKSDIIRLLRKETEQNHMNVNRSLKVFLHMHIFISQIINTL